MLKDRRFDEMRWLVREKNSGMAYVDLRAASRLFKGFTTQGSLAGFTKSGGKGKQDLHAVFQILETLNYMWSTAEVDGDRLRFLVYVAL